MSIFDWARHPHEIQDAREAGNSMMLDRAVHWAVTNQAPELSGFIDASNDAFVSSGYRPSHELSRAIEILIDAYLTDLRSAA